jgi:CopZ-like zinc binding protein
MSSCCTDASCETNVAVSTVCQTCGAKGLPVDPITPKALFTPDALRRGVPSDASFCPTPTCPIVYFGSTGSFTEDDLIVRVHAKHPHDDDVPVCYCFDFTPARIRRENGEASKGIGAEIKAGHCACEVKNPKGACCLGDVIRVEKET